MTSTGLIATTETLCCETASPVVRVAPAPIGTAPVKESQDRPTPTNLVPRDVDSTVANEPDYRTDANKPVRDESLNPTNGSTDPQTSSSTLRNPLPSTGSGGRMRDPLPSSFGSNSGNEATSSSASTEPVKPEPPKDKPVVREEAGAGRIHVQKDFSPSNPANEAAKKGASLDPKTAIPPPIPSPPTSPEPDSIRPLGEEPPSLDNNVPALPEPKVDEGSRRDSYKPVYPSTTLLRSKRNVLEGTIVSAYALNPEENVEVVISDRSGRYVDRTARTNAFGQFAVSLPEGDWTIKVTMPERPDSCRRQGGITANAGKIIDMYGRDLKNLVIKR